MGSPLHEGQVPLLNLGSRLEPLGPKQTGYGGLVPSCGGEGREKDKYIILNTRARARNIYAVLPSPDNFSSDVRLPLTLPTNKITDTIDGRGGVTWI